jgi:hypothetical protein
MVLISRPGSAVFSYRQPVTVHTNLEEFHGVVVGASCEIYCSRTSSSHGPDHGTAITQNSGHNGSAYLPSKLQVSNVAFINFTGLASATSKQDNVIQCSTTHPCYNITHENVLSSPGNQSSFLVENNTVSGSFFVPSY